MSLQMYQYFGVIAHVPATLNLVSAPDSAGSGGTSSDLLHSAQLGPFFIKGFQCRDPAPYL